MTPNNAIEQLHINADKLREFEENGLLKHITFSEDQSDHPDQFIHRICLINFLIKSGMDTDSLKSYLHLLDERTDNQDEQLRMLRELRCKLLEEIHDKQQMLDELDYMIRETKKDNQK